MTYAPDTQDCALDIVRGCIANRRSLRIVGGGTRSALGREVEADDEVNVSRLTGITLYEPAELVMSARVGTPLTEIEQTLQSQRALVLAAYRRDLSRLSVVLSQSRARVGVDTSIEARIAAYSTLLPGAAAKLKPRNADMPYRLLLALMSARLQATQAERAGPRLEHEIWLFSSPLPRPHVLRPQATRPAARHPGHAARHRPPGPGSSSRRPPSGPPSSRRTPPGPSSSGRPGPGSARRPPSDSPSSRRPPSSRPGSGRPAGRPPRRRNDK